MSGLNQSRKFAVVCLLLALGTLLAYLPATRNGFVNFDDQQDIVNNPHVTAGLTWPGVVWAMQSGYAGNWHPLTWISHMLDCQLYGLHAPGHHLTNVILHIANSLLLLALLRRMTGSLWRSAFVAALFAWHPTHVESVAWVSERKDVLSAFFGLLTLLAYAEYTELSKVQSPNSKVLYLLALLLFALGLMSKPMLVSLPCIMLLLDFWPLQRGLAPDGQPSLTALPWRRLFLEKVPFLVLALAASVITFQVQKSGGAMTSVEVLAFPERAANAVVSYLRYLGKTVWPTGLSAFYPYPSHWPTGLVIVSAVLLIAASACCLAFAKRRPYLLTGWFWFLGALVPTIGLVQVGSQSIADRYLYLPSIGLFILAAWGARDLFAAWPQKNRLMIPAAALVLAGCLAVSWRQIGYWRDSGTLFQHALNVTTDNYVAMNGLGGVMRDSGRPTEALNLFQDAVRIRPRDPDGHYNLGTAFLDSGRLDDAIRELTTALTLQPDYAPAQNNLGKALLKQGDLAGAAAHLQQAVDLNPGYAQAHYNLGTVLLGQSKIDDAINQFAEALRLKPDDAETHGNLAVALMRRSRSAEGLTEFAEAVRLQPDNPGAHANFGVALLSQGSLREAAGQFTEALRLNPSDARTHYQLALALARQHDTQGAIDHYRAALRLQPAFADALNNLAWILATDPSPALRNGLEAVPLARRACELTGHQQPVPLLTLAAACAETGGFDEAVTNATKARDLALANKQTDLADQCSRLLKLFQSGQPFRETP